MTLIEARRILEKPKFGDPDTIEAKRIVDDEEEVQSLRKSLVGKSVKCSCCEGTGRLSCECDHYHECPTCLGSKRAQLTQYALERAGLRELREFAAE